MNYSPATQTTDEGLIFHARRRQRELLACSALTAEEVSEVVGLTLVLERWRVAQESSPPERLPLAVAPVVQQEPEPAKPTRRKPRENLACVECGGEFEAAMSNAKFCSGACKERNRRARLRAEPNMLTGTRSNADLLAAATGSTD